MLRNKIEYLMQILHEMKDILAQFRIHKMTRI